MQSEQTEATVDRLEIGTILAVSKTVCGGKLRKPKVLTQWLVVYIWPFCFSYIYILTQSKHISWFKDTHYTASVEPNKQV